MQHKIISFLKGMASSIDLFGALSHEIDIELDDRKALNSDWRSLFTNCDFNEKWWGDDVVIGTKLKDS